MSNPIGWTDRTLNPGIYGCEEVSPECGRCYAATMAHRLGAMGQERYQGLTRKTANGVHWTGEVRVDYAQIVPAFDKLPRRGASRVFVTSMADLFHPSVPRDFQDRVFNEMEARPHLTFQVLTKHPGRMAEFGLANFDADPRVGSWPANVWAGTTAGDQKRADIRVKELLRVPAAVRFVSAEPLLGPVAFSTWGASSWLGYPGEPDSVHWVIAGCESGPKRRPSELDWFRSIRDECATFGARFYLKQLVVDGQVVGKPELDGRTHLEIPDCT